ncbi:glycerate kinase [Methylobacterium sp. J-092]|uniref:glycerate kinase family protein n=1 Tax=Methylobacterium sp. J-092 TaxID=2836667 RepID=UPI001FB95D4B|nr:glycerate kinase [Methylobacterium sp. J-092]MCJ2006761.1 glycerate kinase [Methylobacterium sp. J-092]
MSLTILVAPSGFKESLGARAVTEAIAEGVRRAMPDARILKAPMADGGEGFVEALVSATGGTTHRLTVTGPVGLPVPSFFGFLGGSGPRTAVIEMAAAAGLSLVPRDRRDPTRTTSYGVGELVRAALDDGAARILIGCGDSGINDGGAGMVQALGVGLLDAEDRPLGFGGGELPRLARIDVEGRDPRLERVRIDAAVNWYNELLGERGVARVFGPQKGATPVQVEELECGLSVYARCIRDATGVDCATAPGAGASGGLGAGILGLLGGSLHPRFDVVMRYLAFDGLLAEADLVITAEGSLDAQTHRGKVPAEVGRRAKARGLPVIALAGTLGEGCAENLDHGIDAFASILERPCTLEEAFGRAEEMLVSAAEEAMRMVRVGLEARRDPARSSATAEQRTRAGTDVRTRSVADERQADVALKENVPAEHVVVHQAVAVSGPSRRYQRKDRRVDRDGRKCTGKKKNIGPQLVAAVCNGKADHGEHLLTQTGLGPVLLPA